MNILKKIKILFLAVIFTASCTIIVYENPTRRARNVYTQHWQHCPYPGFWGDIYWQYMWYYRYPYYSRVFTKYQFKSRYKSKKVITKRQLQKPKSTSVSKKKTPTTSVVKVKQKTSQKTVKKKK